MGSRVSGKKGFDVSHGQPFKALHGYQRECYGWQSFRKVTFASFGTGTMVVCLKHVGITDSGQEEVEHVSEDTCKLVRICFEYTSL